MMEPLVFDAPRRKPGRPPKLLAVSALPEDLPAAVGREPLPIRRYTPEMIDEWMLYRLNDRWPGFPEQTWRGKFTGFAASNEYYCIANERGVFLATLMRHTMTNRPIIMETLAWSRDAGRTKDGWENWTMEAHSDAANRLLELYRHAIVWMRGMNAARMVLGVCSDIIPSHLRSVFKGEYLVALP